MKKVFTVAAIALFMMTSCSDDSSSNNNNNNNDTVLLKKIIDTDEDGTFTSIFTYNGNKLVKITNSDGTYETISYDLGGGVTTGLIQEWNTYDSDNTLLEEVNYLYNTQNQLISVTSVGTEDGETYASTVKYTHNADGTITWEDYGDTSHVAKSGKIYQNKFETNVAAFDPWPAHINTSTYTYDGKNNPWKNITGYDKIYFEGTEEGLTWSQNITSEVYSNTLGVNQNYSTTTYTYNSDNYPVTSEENESGYITNTQYFYE